MEKDLKRDIRILKIQVDEIKGMMVGIQDHYRANLIELHGTVSEVMKVATKARNQLGDELHFINGIDTFLDDTAKKPPGSSSK